MEIRQFWPTVCGRINNSKFHLLFLVCLSLVGALILSLVLGDSYDSSKLKLKGAQRRSKRDSSWPSETVLDPFPNRPRILTKNGHLVIESSQNKNIEFKSGPRGAVILNGHRLDQLLDVSKALEKSMAFKKDGDPTSSTGEQYELMLRDLLGSSERILKMERFLVDIKDRITEWSNRVTSVKKQLSKQQKQLKDLSKQQDNIMIKLKRNDCFNNETGQPSCRNGGTCMDGYDGFKCLCTANYEGPTCELDVDECAKFHGTDLGCQNGAKCVNLVGSYRCECTSQFHGVHCTERHDDCSLSSSASLCGHGKCINLARQSSNQARYECVCDQGWTSDGVNAACVIDINECLVGQTSANASLLLDSSVAWSSSLMAAYPCSQNPFVDCINLAGSFQCGPCPPGYTGNGRVCRDVDECLNNNGGCSLRPLVECINTQGSRRCAPCPPGYVGDGISCNLVSACSSEPNGGCHSMAKCVELPGVSLNSRLCVCRYPFVGDGIGISGCRPLSAPNDSLSWPTTELPQDDDCTPNPCLNDAVCRRTDASFECLCPEGITGRLCDVRMSVCGGSFFVSRGSFSFPTGGSFKELIKLSQPDDNKSSSSLDQTERHYNCRWSISVASNMSVKVLFSKLMNKLNPSQHVQVFFANSSGHLVNAPNCAEFLDLYERLDDAEPEQPSNRLVVRFCIESRMLKPGRLTQAVKDDISVVVKSNTAFLDYSFSATRTQFGEPSLAFQFNWTQVEPECGGKLPVAESGSVSSPKFPSFYTAGIECRYVIRVPAGKQIRLQIGELNLLSGRLHAGPCADSLTILDGSIGSDRPVLFRHCANNSTLQTKLQGFKPLISSSSTIELVLLSLTDSISPIMKANQKSGFYITYASEFSTPGCGGLYTTRSATVKSPDYLPAPSGLDDSNLALQVPGYFKYKNDLGTITFWTRRLARNNTRKRWPSSRCEYEIRPAEQSKNHKISIDWLDLPNQIPIDSGSVSEWPRRQRCWNGRLSVYDGNPLDGTNRTEIAVFCSGDRYNSSFTPNMPLMSSGHVLFLVYESIYETAKEISLRPNGFKLHYSTVCSAVYQRLSDSILAEVDSELSECVYHILLPANNSISVIIEPVARESMVLPDGSCAVQAIFFEGATQGTKYDPGEAERQIKGYILDRSRQQRGSENEGVQVARTPDFEEDSTQSSSGTVPNNTYWQYSNSQAYDIKWAEVCKTSLLSIETYWNHLSLLFRLSTGTLGSPDKRKVQLKLKYQAKPSCGGIINEPNEGSIPIYLSKRPLENQSPISQRYGVIQKQLQSEPCAWILKAAPNQIIQLQFQFPDGEIRKRFNEWLKWSRSQPSKQTKDYNFNCSQLFFETIELHEPSLNKTRFICPTDTISVDNSSEFAWSTQTNVLYIQLHNLTSNDSLRQWAGIKPLEINKLGLKYKFMPTSERRCGGKLIHESGYITSPRFPFNYPLHSNCIWTIQANPRQQIRLNFTHFELSRLRGCRSDFLEIRNGPTSDSPLIGRFCGRDLENKVIVSHSSLLWIHFVSDDIWNQVGFELYYDGATTGCGGSLTSPSGQIDSPNYPLPYAHSSDCEWSIEVSKSNKIELTIEDLDLTSDDSGNRCATSGFKTDYLEIFDSSGNFSSKSLGKFCHLDQFNRSSIISTSNRLYITFKSQALDTSRGFRLTYRSICQEIQLIGHSGVIESPGYPASYDLVLRCNWIIRAPLGHNISFSLIKLLDDYESSYTPGNKCSRSHLNFWSIPIDSNITNNSTQPIALESTSLALDSTINYRTVKRPIGSYLVRSLCGDFTNLTDDQRHLEINSSLVYLSFETDLKPFEPYRGFRLEWQSLGCGGHQTYGDRITAIDYVEKANGRPIECLWTFDFVTNTIDISLSSDMRSPDTISKSASEDPCEDSSIIVYDGLTDKDPILSKNCDSRKAHEDIQTSSGQALVRFFSSGRNNYGRGFRLSGRPVNRDTCIMNIISLRTPFNEEAGSQRSPNYPNQYDATKYRCSGLITTVNGRTRIRIEELDIPTSFESQVNGLLDPELCKGSLNYLSFSSGNKEKEMFCGKLLSPMTLVIEHETVWTEFRTSGDFQGRWRYVFDRLCGMKVPLEEPRDISSPNYPSKPGWSKKDDDPTKSENVCIWHFTTSRTSGQQETKSNRQIHIRLINFIDHSPNEGSPHDCLRIYEGIELDIKQSSFNLTDLDSRLKPKVMICKQADVKYFSSNYVSQGEDVVVLLTGEAIARFRVQPFDNSCGGDLMYDKAEFASLGYPQPYGPNLDCNYFILGSPGSRIELKMLDFDLPDAESIGDTTSCDNVDYIELRQMSSATKIKSRIRESIWDEGDSANQTASLKRLIELGQIYSKLVEDGGRYNSRYIKTRFDLSDFYEKSNFIGRYCGKKAPQFKTQELQNQILVRFRSHEPSKNSLSSIKTAAPRGFLVSYKIQYGGLMKITDQQQDEYISSPQFPAKTRYNKSIEWTFETSLDSIIQFDLVGIDLGSNKQDCVDTLSIYDGLNHNKAPRLSSLCGHLSFKFIHPFSSTAQIPIYSAYSQKVRSSLLRPIRTSSNVASVVYRNFFDDGRFFLRYKAIKRTSLEGNQTTNGSEILDINEAIKEQESSPDFDRPSVSKSCSGIYQLSRGSYNTSQITVSSPNYPQLPPNLTECQWLVYTRENTDIKLSVDMASAISRDSLSEFDLFPLARKEPCLDPSNKDIKRNFVVIHDGATSMTPVLARYCLPAPPIHIKSTGRHMLIRYVISGFSEMEKASKNAAISLFKATVSIDECGGQYHAFSHHRIHDRESESQFYGNNLNCKYYVFAGQQDEVLNIIDRMSTFDLASEPTNAACSVGDYIEIRDLPLQPEQMAFSRSMNGYSLGRFCAGRKLENFESPGSAISIEFKTDQKNVARGWSLFVTSTQPKFSCRGTITLTEDELFGQVTSPNWPYGLTGNRQCRYLIEVPLNRTIEIKFVRLNRPVSDSKDSTKNSTCLDAFQYLADNEARVIRNREVPWADISSTFSGSLLKQLVKEVPCISKPPRAMNDYYGMSSDENLSVTNSTSSNFKKITLEEFVRAISTNTGSIQTIKTNSHTLLLDYQTKGLQPGQGFMAVFRVSLGSAKTLCGGDLYPQNERQPKKGPNFFESGNFGVEMKSSDDYIQCEWRLNYEIDFTVNIRTKIVYNGDQSSTLYEFSVLFIVFDTLEVPSLVPDGFLADSRLNSANVAKYNEICGLNRLVATDEYDSQSLQACGNITNGIHRWMMLFSNTNKINLRTRNLPKLVADGQQVQNRIFYRGVRGYFYEKNCLQREKLIGEELRFKSHSSYPNSSYTPGVCQWSLILDGGDYELWFEKVKFRPPANYKPNDTTDICDISDPDLDYVEIRTSADEEGVILARYCIYNQLDNKRKALVLNIRSDIIIMFVAGIKQLSTGSMNFTSTKDDSINTSQPFGFDLMFVRVKNDTEPKFCRHGLEFNIYWMLSGRFWSVIDDHQLYPKNTHCIVDLSIEEGARFNISFWGIFDLELSKDCQSDYVQIDNLISSPGNKSSTNGKLPINQLNKTHLVLPRKTELSTKIGKWCGREKPAGYFISSSNKIRITFHSNERIEGRGFRMEYKTIADNSTLKFLNI